jgi:hypothetical protein
MKRIVLYLVLLGALLYVVKAIAPLIVIGVIRLVVLAWKRPETVSRLTARPKLERVPARGAGRGTGSGNRDVGTGPDPGTHAGAAASADAGCRRDPAAGVAAVEL